MLISITLYTFTYTGDIQTRQTGIILGAASKSASFQGQIDEVSEAYNISDNIVTLFIKRKCTKQLWNDFRITKKLFSSKVRIIFE